MNLNLPVWMSNLKFYLPGWKSIRPDSKGTISHFNNHCRSPKNVLHNKTFRSTDFTPHCSPDMWCVWARGDSGWVWWGLWYAQIQCSMRISNWGRCLGMLKCKVLHENFQFGGGVFVCSNQKTPWEFLTPSLPPPDIWRCQTNIYEYQWKNNYHVFYQYFPTHLCFWFYLKSWWTLFKLSLFSVKLSLLSLFTLPCGGSTKILWYSLWRLSDVCWCLLGRRKILDTTLHE